MPLVFAAVLRRFNVAGTASSALLPDAPVALVEDELLSQLLTRIRAQGFDEEIALQA